MRSDYDKERKRTETQLIGFFRGTLRLTDEEAAKLEEFLHEYVAVRAEEASSDAIDRKFNEGDYRY